MCVCLCIPRHIHRHIHVCIIYIYIYYIGLVVFVSYGAFVYRWGSSESHQQKSQQLQEADYEEPLETAIPLRDNQAYGNVRQLGRFVAVSNHTVQLYIYFAIKLTWVQMWHGVFVCMASVVRVRPRVRELSMRSHWRLSYLSVTTRPMAVLTHRGGTKLRSDALYYSSCCNILCCSD